MCVTHMGTSMQSLCKFLGSSISCQAPKVGSGMYGTELGIVGFGAEVAAT